MTSLSLIVVAASIVVLFLYQFVLESSFGYCPSAGDLPRFASEEDPFNGLLQSNRESLYEMMYKGYQAVKEGLPTDADVSHLRVIQKRKTDNGVFFYVFKNMSTGKKFTSFIPTALHENYNEVECCHWAFEKFEDRVAVSYRGLAQGETISLESPFESLGYA